MIQNEDSLAEFLSFQHLDTINQFKLSINIISDPVQGIVKEREHSKYRIIISCV